MSTVGFVLAWVVFVLVGLPAREARYGGKTLRDWAHQSMSGDSVAAGQALRDAGPAAIEGLTRLLGARDPAWKSGPRRIALNAPGWLRRPLLSWLGMPSATTRPGVARALGLIGPEAYMAAPKLRAALRGGESALQREAATALAKLGPVGLAELTCALESNDATVRLLAADALGSAGAAAEFVVPALVRHLVDEDAKVRAASAYSLPKINPSMVRDLTAAMKSDNDEAREAAMRVLAQRHLSLRLMGAPLREALNSTNAATRREAVKLLGRIDPGGVESIVAIQTCLEDPVLEVRVAAAQTLGQLSGPAARATQTLVNGLDDRSPEVALAVIGALAQAGPNARQALPHLLSLTNHVDDAVRAAAAKAIAAIDPQQVR